MTSEPETLMTRAGCFGVCSGDDNAVRLGARRIDTESSSQENQPQLLAIDDDEAALARELNQLTFEQRERILADIHGVAKGKEETPEFLEMCLSQLDDALPRVPSTKRKDLDLAFFLKPALAMDKNFKLMFLRADEYNARLAADRMARFFTTKRSLFGVDKLVKDITLDDLERNDIDIVNSAMSYISCSYKDTTGRPIWFHDGRKIPFNATSIDQEKESLQFRLFFYQMLAVLEDEEAQKKGVVIVFHMPSSGAFSANRLPMHEIAQSSRRATKVVESLPIRVASNHHCFGDDPLLCLFFRTIQACLGKHERMRRRAHAGTVIELKYALLAFGIPTDGMIEAGGDKQPALLQEYLERRREIDKLVEKQRLEKEAATGTITFAGANDVLMGRGRPYQEYPMNRSFLDIINDERPRYSRCHHYFEKEHVAMDVIKMVHDKGGRFLKRNPDGWKLSDDKAVIKRICAAFRNTPGGLAVVAASEGGTERRTPKRLKIDTHDNTLASLTPKGL